ncbi:MAG: tol-pal system protein YbgF [Pseudomonadota bacterium]|nr:tol-pal system protein YbgF [Pseudomonadota bacterium]
MKNLSFRLVPAAAILLCCMVSGPSMAQTVDVTSMNNRVMRLENELRTLNQAVYKGQPPPPGTGTGTSYEDRLTRLEQETSKLTGRVEELQFSMRKLQDAQAKAARDMEFRLNELEKKAATHAPVAAPAPPPATATPSPFTGQQSYPPAGGQAPAALTGDPRKDYDNAYALLLQADYNAAENALKAFIAANPQHELTGNAQYWLAETYYVRGMYPEAALAFGEGFEKYPDSQKAPDNLLKLGLSLVKLNKRQEACRTLGLVKKNFPDGPEATRAKAEQERTRLKCG